MLRRRFSPREEVEPAAAGNDDFCWMNAAYVMGARMTDAFAKTGFCTTIRGAEGGGRVEGLPAYTFVSDDGDPDTCEPIGSAAYAGMPTDIK